jgi:hypothetical protein
MLKICHAVVVFFLPLVCDKAMAATLRGKIHLMPQVRLAKKEQTLFTG